MESLKKNGIWELIDHPPAKKALKCKWVYSVHLGIQSFRSINPNDVKRDSYQMVSQNVMVMITFEILPMAKLSSIKILISILTTFSWSIITNFSWPPQQLDVRIPSNMVAYKKKFVLLLQSLHYRNKQKRCAG